jgi:outer membrane protein assembly factor BamB
MRAETGESIWTRSLGDGVIDKTLAVGGGLAYIVSRDSGKLYALDAVTGAIRWTVETGGHGGSSPVLYDGRVYVTTGDRGAAVRSYDAATGAHRWSQAIGEILYAEPAVADGVVFVGGQDGSIRTFDAATGHPGWAASLGEAVTVPVVRGKALYVVTAHGYVYALDSTRGSVRWVTLLPMEPGSDYDTVRRAPAVAYGLIYVGSGDIGIHALHAGTGVEVWSAGTETAAACIGASGGTPSVAGGVVYLAGCNHTVYAFNAISGTPLWEHFVGSGGGFYGLNTSPVVLDGTMYVAVTFSYGVWAFRRE